MPQVIDIIEGCVIYEDDDGAVRFTARARIDTDGSGDHHGDKTADDDTSLHVDRKPLNADVDRYIVVPPQIIMGVKGVVLGCQAVVNYNGRMFGAVVGDVGPRERLGEISYCLAVALGIDPDPNTGGIDDPIVRYMLHPGVPAARGGATYPLQPSA